MSSFTVTTIHPARTATQRKNNNGKPGRANYAHIHRNLLPVQTVPLPVLIPHNPLSLVAIALSYLVQVLAPPQRPVYDGYFSSATSSIHITDETTQRALWEMGFFGRGSLSRSEPTWLENQKNIGITAEENTNRRRDERRKAKLERARKEQEEIQTQLSSEEVAALSSLDRPKEKEVDLHEVSRDAVLHPPPALHLPTSRSSVETKDPIKRDIANGNSNGSPVLNKNAIHGFEEWKRIIEVNGLPTPPATSTSSESSQGDDATVNAAAVDRKARKQKTVRFSPTIEAREFDLSSPVISPIKAPAVSPFDEPLLTTTKPTVIENREHLQLSMEEAFFLSYSLGVLRVSSDGSKSTLSTTSLFSLFRRHSCRPVQTVSAASSPDDPFMLSYAVYHHYRSMGWIVRSGVKFGVDYLLYNRGPAFTHAEFAVVVLPSYKDEYWYETEDRRRHVEKKSRKTWWWLHGTNRVQAQVLKHLVLCYVDVPAPPGGLDTGSKLDIGALLSTYKIRDISVKRWSPNRGRD